MSKYDDEVVAAAARVADAILRMKRLDRVMPELTILLRKHQHIKEKEHIKQAQRADGSLRLIIGPHDFKMTVPYEDRK